MECGVEELQRFQFALGPTYQLIVISRDFFNTIVYKGPHEVEKKIHLYHAHHHYSVITSMPAFLERHNYCSNCHVGYTHKDSHVCKNGCKCCRKSTPCVLTEWMVCQACRRRFVSPSCYQHHLASGLCAILRACEVCGKVVRRSHKHECGVAYCKICRSRQPIDHLCFMQPLKGGRGPESEPEGYDEEDMDFDEVEEMAERKAKQKKYQQYIFYDFESMVIDHKHVPNLCVLHKVCELCIEHPDIQTSQCPCKPTQVVFSGPDTLQDVGKYLFSGEHGGATCVAHNSQVSKSHVF